MTPDRLPVECDEPNWDQLLSDVTLRIALLRACWKGTTKDEPELHKKVVEDLYIPALSLLAQFCAAVEVADDDDDT